MKTKNFFQKYKVVIVIVLLTILFLIIQRCNSNEYQQLNGQYDILKSQYQLEKNKLNKLEIFNQKIKDSLNKEIDKRDVENQILMFDFNELEKSIQKIKSQKIIVPNNAKDLVNHFNNRFKTNENLFINDKISMTSNIGYKIAYELEEKDNLFQISNLKDKQIQNQDSQIDNLIKNNQDISAKLLLTEDEKNKFKDLNNLAYKNINNLEKQVKTLKRKNTLTKILVPVALIGGGFIGYKIAK